MHLQLLAPSPPVGTKIPEELGSDPHSVSPWQNSPCFLFLSTANVIFPLLVWGALSSSASHLLPDGKWVIFIPSSSVAWHWGSFPAAACLDWDILQDWSGIWLSPSEFPDWKGCVQYWWNETGLVPTREHGNLVCVLKWRNGEVYLFCWKLQKMKSGVLRVRDQPGASSAFLQDQWVLACFPVGKAWGLHQISFRYSGWAGVFLGDHPHHPWAVVDKAGLVQAGLLFPPS